MVKVIIKNIEKTTIKTKDRPEKTTIKTKDRPEKTTIKTKSRSKRTKHIYNRVTASDYEEHIGGGYMSKISNVFNIFINKQNQEEVENNKKILENGIEEKEPQLLASTDLEPLTESEISVAGKGIFTSFLKSSSTAITNSKLSAILEVVYILKRSS